MLNLTLHGRLTNNNVQVRRGVLTFGLWVLGVGVAATFAFAAVGRVANGVAEPNVSSLSREAIDNELTANVANASGPTAPGTSPRASTVSPTTRHENTSTTLTSSPKTPSTSARPVTRSPTTTNAGPVSPTMPTPTTAPATPNGGTLETVTTSQGGTLWTRCSGENVIVYVAAVPKSGFRRSVDQERDAGIEQKFENGTHSSDIRAECSNGVVHPEVEEESSDT